MHPQPPRPPKREAWHPNPRPRKELLRPRKVRSGVKLTMSDEDLRGNWAAERWIRLIEAAAPGEQMVEGVEYARLGQARSVEYEPATVEAFVQGRSYTPYRTTVSLPRFGEDKWVQAIASMAEEAVYAAKLLVGELPSNIEDLFAPLGVKLFPAEPSELKVTCSCREESDWCKHTVCVAHLIAQQLANDPFTVFTLRGMPGRELLERLRQRRAVSGVSGEVPVYVPRVEGVSDIIAPDLDQQLENFWQVGPDLAEIDTPMDPPEVDKPLLRRLGQSPFTESRFPLVGLLATCYDLIAEAARPDAPGDLLDDMDAEADGAAPEAEAPVEEPPAPRPVMKPKVKGVVGKGRAQRKK
ncbi:MAG: hypothetical protein EA423_05870 [Phycisphaerales bacterium]|nr:MAG: hypothetical protein EA423_05870 [Phycisphaerales bacterium]